MADLVALGERLGELIPDLKPVFLNLGAMSPVKLEAEGGFFGWVLKLVQQRKARPEEFQSLLGRAIQELEAMPRCERIRWLELLSYIHALVYHERDPLEHQNCREAIESSVRTDEHRQEVFVPDRENIEDGEHRDGRTRQRQRDVPVGTETSATVDRGGILDLLG